MARRWLNLLLALLTLALLPMLYSAALALPIWAVHFWHAHLGLTAIRWHSYRHHPLFSWTFFNLLVYSFLCLVELALLLSLLKPLLARRAARTGSVPLDPASEPVFYEFVANIANWLQAPVPQRIEFDCGINATLRLSPGFTGVFHKTPVLRIGLPVIAALNSRELAGIIGHELRHLRQGTVLRLSFLLGRIHRWLIPPPGERDSWDLWLERQGSNSGFGFGLLLSANRCSRWLLRAILFPTRCASSFLLREMERDADRYEVTLAGTAAVESAIYRLAVLAEAFNRANKETQATWSLGRHLPDNFPVLVLMHDSNLPVALRDIIHTRVLSTRTRLFDSHPSSTERIRRARATAEPGVFDQEIPASALLSEFHKLAKQATFSHYVLDLRLNLETSTLRPVDPQPFRH